MSRFRDWFLASMEGVKVHLLRHSQPNKLMFVGEERETGEFYAKMVGTWSVIASLVL